ncbi:MAG: exopolysaccharide biosynthesis protein, partial [Candidatus Obscuribacterales bacterium]|nr:exopolysaccharide biosynthesis protein [Steroidobacteraceae bacterium]
MERISRALETARTQREARLEPRISIVDGEGAHSPDLCDTRVIQLPVIELDAARRERERILEPGSGGVNGGPYKMLRTQVLKRLDQLNANTLAVLSAGAGDGKTLTAINLAIAIAADSHR